MNHIEEFVKDYVFRHDGGHKYKPDYVENAIIKDAINLFMQKHGLEFKKDKFSFTTYKKSDAGHQMDKETFKNTPHDHGYGLAYDLDAYGGILLDTTPIFSNNLPEYFEDCKGVIFYGKL